MIIVWIAFLVLILALVMLDLGVFHRKAHVISIPEALAWTGVWIVLALAFNVFIFFMYDQNWFGTADIPSRDLSGKQAAVQFFTGYLLEKSLSVDNIFVIAMIFSYFGVPLAEQHRVLYWGILGAVVLRAIMIALGVALINKFDWIVYVFGALLFMSAAKMLFIRHDNIHLDRNPFVRAVRRYYPITSQFHGSRFFVKENGVRAATPLFLALVLVETSDVMFAIDSIPAIFAVTRDPFLVFTSNVFAILGLRALYFAVAGMMHKFRYLKLSLVFILAYVGVKMILSHHYPIPNLTSLAIIGAALSIGMLASILATPREEKQLVSPLVDDLESLAALTYREARRVAILTLGMTIVLLGLIMLVTPGPGLVVIILGLAILGAEFAWARTWLKRMREVAGDVGDRVMHAFDHDEKRPPE
ncbi:MAG: TerC/Alx family metal homeostasis membrane protein [Gammaproteobacteria bacterium]|nr:TerC/Alx family metal homeostasis membrane protein [Gammaproteobacteria bacterium]